MPNRVGYQERFQFRPRDTAGATAPPLYSMLKSAGCEIRPELWPQYGENNHGGETNEEVLRPPKRNRKLSMSDKNVHLFSFKSEESKPTRASSMWVCCPSDGEARVALTSPPGTGWLTRNTPSRSVNARLATN